MLVQVDVQGHHFLALGSQRKHESGMDGRVPFHNRFAVDVAHLCSHILGKQCLGTDKVQLPKRFQHAGQFIEVRTDLVGHLGEDAYNFASDFGLSLTDAVVGLDDGIGLNEHCLACGTLVMHDTMQFALVHGTHGQHQTPVAQRRLHIVLQNAVLLTLGDDAAQGAVDAAGHTGNRNTQLMQVRRCRVLDVAGLIEHMPDGATQLGEGLHTAGELPQSRIRRIAVTVGSKETDNLTDSNQQTLQVKQALGRQECAGRGNLLEHDTQVEIVTQRKFTARLKDGQELVGLLKPADDLIATGRETQARHVCRPQRAHAVTFQFASDGIKANLSLKS